MPSLSPISNLSPLASAPSAATTIPTGKPANTASPTIRRTADASCGDKFWEGDLESVDVVWFEQPTAVLLCEDCLTESEGSESSNADTGNDAVLPNQMEIERQGSAAAARRPLQPLVGLFLLLLQLAQDQFVEKPVAKPSSHFR